MQETMIRIARRVYPVGVLGPGTRAVVWTQGCTIACPGCMSRHTWSARAGELVPVADLVDWVRGLIQQGLDGVTVSGGEPTEQPEALRALLSGLAGLEGFGESRDVLVYTGREPEWVMGAGAGLLTGADAVVAGPYVARLSGDSPLRGSENQRILPLSQLGRARYAGDAMLPSRLHVQVSLSEGQVELVGIPLAGDLAELRARLAEQGVQLRGVSWTS